MSEYRYNPISGNHERIETAHDRKISKQVRDWQHRVIAQNEARILAENGTLDPFEMFDK
jgi:hypothetical protein